MWNYFKEVRGELKHVSWPSRRLTVLYTAVVIGVSVLVSVYLGLLDYVFRLGIEHLI